MALLKESSIKKILATICTSFFPLSFSFGNYVSKNYLFYEYEYRNFAINETGLKMAMNKNCVIRALM